MTAYWDEESIIADILDGCNSIPAILDRHAPNMTGIERERAWKRVWTTIKASTRICKDGKKKYAHEGKGFNYRRRHVMTYTVKEASA